MASASALALALGCNAKRSDSAEGASDLVGANDLVISQVYGGGGTGGAPFKQDFIELFNRGTEPVSLGGKSLQYASSDGAFSSTDNTIVLPDRMLEPGRYFLIGLSGGPNGAALQAPDLSDLQTVKLNLAKDKGKVALVSSSALLDACGKEASPCADGAAIDIVRYGLTPRAEDSHTDSLGSATAARRRDGGCFYKGDNGADFEVVAPTPRSKDTPAHICSVDGGAAEAVADDGGTDGSADDGAASDTDAAVDGGEDAGKDGGRPSPKPRPKKDAGSGGSGGDDDDDDQGSVNENPTDETGNPIPGSSSGGSSGASTTKKPPIRSPASPPNAPAATLSSDCAMSSGPTNAGGHLAAIAALTIALAARGRRRSRAQSKA
jgi:hypothetical protein